VRVDGNGAFHIESVAATLGDRPWVLERMREGIRAGRLIGDPDLTEEEEGNGSAPETSDDED
jgi:hypothetical protein